MRHDRRRQLTYEVARLAQLGRSHRQIAEVLGIARRTVKRLLAELDERRSEGESAIERDLPVRVPRGSQLDAYDALMRQWLTEFPKLTAVRCKEKLEAEGYQGSYTIVRERLKALRRELQPEKASATPFETAPGERAEFDWSPYNLSDGVKVQLWNASLRWSRACTPAAAHNQKQTTIMRMLRASFESWQGVPRSCLTDSMPGVVDRWECDMPLLNARFVDFAAHYGFSVLIAPRRCPTWKAVAERLFGYHEKNLLNGRVFRSFEDYVEALERWTREQAQQRPHPETERPIAEMLELERPHLLPLPAHPYDTRDVFVRLVDGYQRVGVETNYYPAPAAVGDLVYVCADAERVIICDHMARRLIEHERLPAGAQIKLDPPHSRKVRYDLDELVERVGSWSESALAFAQELRAARRFAGPELVRLLQLQVDWRRDDLVAAMEQARRYRCYEVTKIERILETRFTPRRFEERIADSTRERLRAVMKSHPIRQRSLSSYDALRRGDALSEARSEDGPGEPQQTQSEDDDDRTP